MTNPTPSRFDSHLLGCLLGVALGDGMGGPIEGLTADEIARRFPTWDWTTFLPPQEWKPKGDGRITDDTLMTEALMRAYIAAGDHLDAYGFRDFLLPEMCERQVWVPELQREMAIIERLNYLERYTVIRLRHVGAEPRIAGLGNGLNCAIAMYIMPVGAVNAGDPFAAYHEAAAFGLAESHAFAVEGAAVLAAAYAAALTVGATPATVIAVAQGLAKDGTAHAIQAAVAASDPADPVARWVERVLTAVEPYSNRTNASDGEHTWQMGCRNNPDPRLCFEEVPVALAALQYGQGDFCRTMEAACRFGRDADSIAGMACGLCGALVGRAGIPDTLVEASQTANDRNWTADAAAFAATCRTIHARDAARWGQRQQALA